MRPVCWALGLWAGAAWAAPPVEMIDYTIQDGDTCSAIAAKLYKDKLRWDVIHDYNPQLGKRLPHSLEEGQILRLPKTLPPDAWVSGVRRQVEHRPSVQGAWLPSKTGTQLRLGFRVSTRERSAAELTFLDESQLQLREETLIILYGKGASGARRSTSRARLERGALRGRLAELAGKKSSKLLVSTPSAESSMSSGAAVFSVDPDGSNSVSNHSSKSIQVRGTAGGAVKVKKGMGTRVKRGERPAKPRKLPSPPKWWGAQAVTLVGARAEDATLKARWSAKGERVRVSVRALSASSPLAETEVPVDLPVLRLRGLEAGTYAVSLSVIDDMGLESRPSNALTVEIKAADAAIPVVVGGALPLPPGSICDGPDGRTAQPLPGTGTQTLQCSDAAGTALPPLNLNVQPAEVAPLTASGRAGKTAKLRFKIKGAGLPSVLDAVLPDGQTVPLRPGPKGWTAAIPIDAKAPKTLPIEIRDPDMLYGPPVARVELTVKGGLQ